MIIVALPPPERLRRDLMARIGAITSYREGAASLRALAQDIEAGCSDRPCVEASELRRLARHADDAAWLEEHNPAGEAGR